MLPIPFIPDLDAADAEDTLTSRFNALAVLISGMESQLTTAAGTKPDLTTFLQVAHNLDGSIKAGAPTAGFWTQEATAVRVDSTHIKIPVVDLTARYEVNRRVAIINADTSESRHGVVSAVFTNGETIVTLTGTIAANASTFFYHSGENSNYPLAPQFELLPIFGSIDFAQNYLLAHDTAGNKARITPAQIVANSQPLNTNLTSYTAKSLTTLQADIAATTPNGDINALMATLNAGAADFISIMIGGQHYKITAQDFSNAFPPSMEKRTDDPPAIALNEGRMWYRMDLRINRQVIGNFNGFWSTGPSVLSVRHTAAMVGVHNASIIGGGHSGASLSSSNLGNGTNFISGPNLLAIREDLGAFGLQSNALFGMGSNGTTRYASTEIYNGTAFSAGPNVTTTGSTRPGCAGNITSGLFFGGGNPGNTSNAEKFNGTVFTIATPYPFAVGSPGKNMGGGTDSIGYSGDVGGSSSNSSFQYNVTSWITLGAVPYLTSGSGGFGTVTEAFACGGQNPTAQNNVARWKDNAWSSMAPMLSARFTHGSCGNAANALVAAGYNGGSLSSTENYTTQPYIYRNV